MPSPSSPSGQPERIPYDRGSIERLSESERQNQSLLIAELRHSVNNGEISASEFAGWLSKPWTAYEFLATRVSHVQESLGANPVVGAGTLRPGEILGAMRDLAVETWQTLLGRDVLTTLAEWAEEAEKSAAERIAWEQNPANATRREAAEKAGQGLHAVLS